MWKNVSIECDKNQYIADMANLMIFNMSRTDSLLELYKTLSGNPYKDDLLRSSIVFTHASLEDSLRTIATYYLPNGKKDVLDKIPLVGAKNAKGQPYKFYLGNLLKFKDKKIETVIEASVTEYLSRQTYNNTKDITTLLIDIGLEKGKLQHFYPLIDTLCNRRHKIVHRADRILNHQEISFENITLEQVELWRANALNFILHISFSCAWEQNIEIVIVKSNEAGVVIKKTIFDPETSNEVGVVIKKIIF